MTITAAETSGRRLATGSGAGRTSDRLSLIGRFRTGFVSNLLLFRSSTNVLQIFAPRIRQATPWQAGR